MKKGVKKVCRTKGKKNTQKEGTSLVTKGASLVKKRCSTAAVRKTTSLVKRCDANTRTEEGKNTLENKVYLVKNGAARGRKGTTFVKKVHHSY